MNDQGNAISFELSPEGSFKLKVSVVVCEPVIVEGDDVQIVRGSTGLLNPSWAFAQSFTE